MNMDQPHGAGGSGVTTAFRGIILDVPQSFPQTAEFYRYLFGEPKFVDGESWAPFRHSGDTSVSLAGPREATGATIALTFKVSDLEQAREELCARGGRSTGEITEGLHQRQITVIDPVGNTVMIYAPLVTKD